MEVVIDFRWNFAHITVIKCQRDDDKNVIKKGGHHVRFHGTTLTNTAIWATLTIAGHPQCWTSLARFYKCYPTYNTERGVILWFIQLRTWKMYLNAFVST